jgi:hypothetical protein
VWYFLRAGASPQKVPHISSHHRISQRPLFSLQMPNTYRPVDPADRIKRSAAFKAEMDDLFTLPPKLGQILPVGAQVIIQDLSGYIHICNDRIQ